MTLLSLQFASISGPGMYIQAQSTITHLFSYNRIYAIRTAKRVLVYTTPTYKKKKNGRVRTKKRNKKSETRVPTTVQRLVIINLPAVTHTTVTTYQVLVCL